MILIFIRVCGAAAARVCFYHTPVILHSKALSCQQDSLLYQPFGFIATKACKQTAKTALWRVAVSGLPCKYQATPRGTVEV